MSGHKPLEMWFLFCFMTYHNEYFEPALTQRGCCMEHTITTPSQSVLWLFSWCIVLVYAGVSSERKRRRISSTYTERLRNLPSASQMSQVDMRQQQGCLHYDFVLQQPLLKSVREPLYLNYRCEARQVTISPQMETFDSWVVCLVILHQILTP